MAAPLSESEFDAVISRMTGAAVKDCKGSEHAAAGLMIIAAFRLAVKYGGAPAAAALLLMATEFTEDQLG